MTRLVLQDQTLKLSEVIGYCFHRNHSPEVELSLALKDRVQKSHHHLLTYIEKRVPIYGVTTGFGDSCHRFVSPEQSYELQRNLISYLNCGTGPLLPPEAARATFLVHLKSLSRGFSGVSFELLERMRLFLSNDWIPAIPREGSLGASGDLIPLAYIARAIEGEGNFYSKNGSALVQDVALTLKAAGVAPYRLKPKEGLALVNGTSAMSGTAIYNYTRARFSTRLAATASAWQCLALQGRIEAFTPLVNQKAKLHVGQARVAEKIYSLLKEEEYAPAAGHSVHVKENGLTEGFVQDRYSLRCSPQVLGPIEETLDQCAIWLEREINSTSDNPIIDEDGSLGMGGNFYGGYLAHSMDYLKISLATLSDLLDRQVMMLMDERANRGLPPNLTGAIPKTETERHLHHGLKGIHQATSAITSEVIQRSFPGSVLSRSSESHNQDKVSLGMSAAVQLYEMQEQVFTLQSMQLIALCQALDLRRVTLKGAQSRELYQTVRQKVPFVSSDRPLGEAVLQLTQELKRQAGINEEEPFHEKL